MTSYGIIVKHPTQLKFLLVQRRDSHAYLSFFKYFKNYSEEELQKCFEGMTENEKKKLLQYDFNTLWNDLYTDQNSFHFNVYRNYAAYMYHLFKESTISNTMCKDSKSKSLEWGFPKGCINYGEEPLFCALREFKEETTISYEEIQIMKDVNPFTFFLYNKPCIFYSANACNEFKFEYKKSNIREKYLTNETSDAKWFSIEEIEQFSWSDPQMITFLKNLDTNK